MDDKNYGLVYPFVVCTSKEGPYDDDAFVAGCYFGQIKEQCKTIGLGYKKEWCVPSPLVPQLELLAIHEGCAMMAQPWNDHPDEWTFVTMQRLYHRGEQ